MGEGLPWATDGRVDMMKIDRLIESAPLNIGYYITNANGKPFKNKTALSRAKNFYSGYERRTPQDGDYTCVMADGTCKKRNGEYPITRYTYRDGKWVFQYIVGYRQEHRKEIL